MATEYLMYTYASQKSTALTKTGKEYENVMLADKTGQIDSKIWGCEFWWNKETLM